MDIERFGKENEVHSGVVAIVGGYAAVVGGMRGLDCLGRWVIVKFDWERSNLRLMADSLHSRKSLEKICFRQAQHH